MGARSMRTARPSRAFSCENVIVIRTLAARGRDLLRPRAKASARADDATRRHKNHIIQKRNLYIQYDPLPFVRGQAMMPGPLHVAVAVLATAPDSIPHSFVPRTMRK